MPACCLRPDGISMWKNPELGTQRVDNNNPPGSRVWFSLTKRMPIGDLAVLLQRYGALESVHFMSGVSWAPRGCFGHLPPAPQFWQIKK